MEVRLDGHKESLHASKRIAERIKEMDVMNVGFEFIKGEYTNHGTFTFTDEIKEELIGRVEFMCATWFETFEDCGLLLFDFDLNNNLDKIEFSSKAHKRDAKKNIAANKQLFLLSTKSESNGDLLFAIVRKQNFKTLMFVKSYMKNLEKKLRIDKVII